MGPGSWYLPLEIGLIPVGQAPTQFGATQVGAYVQRWGWQPDEILAVDAAYTNAPTLRPLVAAGVNTLGRVSSKRVFYLVGASLFLAWIGPCGRVGGIVVSAFPPA